MDCARATAHAGDSTRLWIVSDEQTGGRGRDGRSWWSPRGNLYASCLLVAESEPARAPELGFVAGLALVEALHVLSPQGPQGLALKWPNDLLFRGAKVAGILLEGWRDTANRFCCTIGLGVNCVSCPPDVPYRVANLRDAGLESDRGTLLMALSDAFARGLSAWQENGFEPVRHSWLAHAAHLGQRIEVRLPHRQSSGTFTTIDPYGRLVLTSDGAPMTIAAGDLFPMTGDEPAEHVMKSFYG